jgi:hypothetical protein
VATNQAPANRKETNSMTEFEAAQSRWDIAVAARQRLLAMVEELEKAHAVQRPDLEMLGRAIKRGGEELAGIADTHAEAIEYGCDEYGQPLAGEPARVNRMAATLCDALSHDWHHLINRASQQRYSMLQPWTDNVRTLAMEAATAG